MSFNKNNFGKSEMYQNNYEEEEEDDTNYNPHNNYNNDNDDNLENEEYNENNYNKDYNENKYNINTKELEDQRIEIAEYYEGDKDSVKNIYEVKEHLNYNTDSNRIDYKEKNLNLIENSIYPNTEDMLIGNSKNKKIDYNTYQMYNKDSRVKTPEELFSKANQEIKNISNKFNRPQTDKNPTKNYIYNNNEEEEQSKHKSSKVNVNVNNNNQHYNFNYANNNKSVNTENQVTKNKITNKKHEDEIEDEDFNNDNEKDMESFEQDLELAKQLNSLKEENKSLKKENKDQQSQIRDLEDNLQEALLKIAELEDKLEVINPSQASQQENKLIIKANEEVKKLTLQVNKQNAVIEKLKNESKEEINMIKEKLNEAQKKVDLAVNFEKKSKQEILIRDKKIAKLVEELDKTGKVNKKENNTISDKQNIELNLEVKQLEKQKNELFQALKKSLKLVSILKRQKAHLESCRLLNISEEKLSQLFMESNNN